MEIGELSTVHDFPGTLWWCVLSHADIRVVNEEEKYSRFLPFDEKQILWGMVLYWEVVSMCKI